MAKVKTDCFAFVKDSVRGCQALKKMECRYGECVFYKTKEQLLKENPDYYEKYRDF